MKTLFYEDVCCRDFGSSVLHAPTLLAWAASKGLYLQSVEPLDDYDFVQVEAVLCEIERWVSLSVTRDQAVAIVAADPELQKSRSANRAPHWLVGARTHTQWRGILSTAIEAGELNLRGYPSLLPIAAVSKAEPVNDVPFKSPSGSETTNAPNVDDTLSALFDPVPVEALEKMFPADGKWRGWADKAKANGLKKARISRAKFNPYKAGMWFFNLGVKDWDMARIYRTLVKNLPGRSKDYAHLLTGHID